MLISTAWAQGAVASQGSQLMAWLPLVMVFAVFYFLVLRPQSQRAKEHANMLTTLKRGDKILTTGGLHATITKVNGDTLEITFTEGKAVLETTSVASVLMRAVDVKTPAKKLKKTKSKK